MDDKTRTIQAQLNKNLERLNKNLEKQNSFVRNIWMGMLKGAAGAIGATLVAGIILAILARTLDSAKDFAVLRPFVSDRLEESLKQK